MMNDYTKTRILVLGHGEHGKGTFSKLLCKRFSITTMSSSFAALPFIFPTLQHLLGYRSPDEAYADRMNHRILWRDLISLLNSPDKTTLSKLILERAQIYDGMRDLEEYINSFHLFSFIFWVDASNRVKKVDKSMNIKFNPKFMYLVDNNGPEENLKEIVNSMELFT